MGYVYQSFGAIIEDVFLGTSGASVPVVVPGTFKVYGMYFASPSANNIIINITKNDADLTALFSFVASSNTSINFSIPFFADSGLVISYVGTVAPHATLIRSNTGA